MPKTKTKAELLAENKLLRTQNWIAAFTTLGNRLITWGGAVAIAYLGYRSIDALAGKSTVSDIGIKLLGNVRISEGLAWVLGGGGTLYGISQRKLRRDTIERLQGRITELEKEHDPKRSSSNLTVRGTTPTETQ